MKKTVNLFVKADSGINTYEPASAVSGKLRFTRLVNLEARRGCLFVSKGLAKITDINQLFNTFASYTDVGNNSFLYAFSDTGLYAWDQAGSSFNTSPLQTYTANVGEPWAAVDYTDGLYFTRHGVTLRKVVDTTLTSINSYEARYARNAQDHLLLANFNETSGAYKVRWSDLYAFNDFTPTQSNEADEYAFNPAYGEITGITIQRDLINFYLEKGIFQARYVGFPLKYVINPLFTDIGNKYHHAVIQTQDVDYFIGEDNFYRLEGTVLTAIGDPVWEYFRDSLASLDYGQEVRGVHDVDRSRVGWLYTRRNDETYPNGLRSQKKYWLWFYYKEQRWSTEEADFISLFKPMRRMYFYETIDEQTQTIDSESRSIDGLWQTTEFLYHGGIFGGEDESIYSLDTGYDGKQLHFETCELHLQEPAIVKTLQAITVHGEVGSTASLSEYFTNVSVEVGYRRKDQTSLTWVTLTSTARPDVNTMEFIVDPGTVPAANAFALRFHHNNTGTIYITAITGFTFTFSVPNSADDKK